MLYLPACMSYTCNYLMIQACAMHVLAIQRLCVHTCVTKHISSSLVPCYCRRVQCDKTALSFALFSLYQNYN